MRVHKYFTLNQMKKVFILISVITIYCQAAFSQQGISISAKPCKIYIERGESAQQLNFDFLLSKLSADTLTLTKITVRVSDKNKVLVQTRFLDNNGTAPSIQTISKREFNGASSQLIFNPFTEFSLGLPLYKLEYEFVFTDNQDRETKIISTVYPQAYVQSKSFTLPLKERVLVYDAHDFYDHHRRFDYNFAPIKQLGIQTNFMRYAYDFVPVNKNHELFLNKGDADADYVGFAQSVYVIGDGKVIYASNNHEDNKKFNIPAMANNPLELYGNCVAIQHADGVVSIYGHLKQNSVRMKVGDRVVQKQEIGKIGVSGSSFFPHLHFEIRTSIDHQAEGIPSYFSDVYLLEGSTETKLKSGLAETGNIIESRAK